MIRTLSTLAGLLIAGSAAAAPISSWQVTNHFIQDGFTTAVVDTASLSTEVYVDFITQFKAPVAVGQAVVVSLTSGSVFDQMVALYTNGVTDNGTYVPEPGSALLAATALLLAFGTARRAGLRP